MVYQRLPLWYVFHPITFNYSSADPSYVRKLDPFHQSFLRVKSVSISCGVGYRTPGDYTFTSTSTCSRP